MTGWHVTAVLLLVAASAAADLPACLPACSGVDLRETDLRGANLRGAVLAEAILIGAGPPGGLHGSDLVSRQFGTRSRGRFSSSRTCTGQRRPSCEF